MSRCTDDDAINKEKVMDKNKKKIVKKKDIEKIMQKIMRKLSAAASVSLFPCSSVHLSDTAVSITDCVPSSYLHKVV